MVLSNRVILKLNSEENSVRCFHYKKSWILSFQDLRFSVCVSVYLCVPFVFHHSCIHLFYQNIQFKIFDHTMGCAGTFYLSLYSLLYGGLRVMCTINTNVRGSRKFKFCSGSQRRQVSGQLQSLCLMGQEYQAYSGWKRSRKTPCQTRVLIQRPRSPAVVMFGAPARTSVVLNWFLY